MFNMLNITYAYYTKNTSIKFTESQIKTVFDTAYLSGVTLDAKQSADQVNEKFNRSMGKG